MAAEAPVVTRSVLAVLARANAPGVSHFDRATLMRAVIPRVPQLVILWEAMSRHLPPGIHPAAAPPAVLENFVNAAVIIMDGSATPGPAFEASSSAAALDPPPHLQDSGWGQSSSQAWSAGWGSDSHHADWGG